MNRNIALHTYHRSRKSTGGSGSFEPGNGVGGGDDLARALVERTITEYSNGELETVNYGAFAQCTALQKFIAPKVKTIADQAFYKCSKLEVFDCGQEVETIGGSAFTGVTKLAEARFPKCTNVGGSCFENAYIYTLEIPNLTTVGGNAFMGCRMRSAVFPKITTITARMFKGCGYLTTADFTDAAAVAADAFYGCKVLKTLILRNAEKLAVCENATTVFTNSPYANGGSGGVILVPRAFVTEYPIATNWAAWYAYGNMAFLAIEDYTMDGTVTGEIDWDKVNALFEEASA